MFITKKRLQNLEKRIADLEKAQNQSNKFDLEEMKKAVKEQIMRTGKNPFDL